MVAFLINVGKKCLILELGKRGKFAVDCVWNDKTSLKRLFRQNLVFEQNWIFVNWRKNVKAYKEVNFLQNVFYWCQLEGAKYPDGSLPRLLFLNQILFQLFLLKTGIKTEK